MGASASAIDGALVGSSCSPARSSGSALPPHVCIRLAFMALRDHLSHPGVACCSILKFMRMLSRCGMYADVSEPLPPTEEVLSGMDEDFHPDSGSSEGKLFAVPSCPPTSLRLVSADIDCYLPWCERGGVMKSSHHQAAVLCSAHQTAVLISPGAYSLSFRMHFRRLSA